MPKVDSQLDANRLKAQLVDRISSIEGWTYLDEAWALHEAVRCYPGCEALRVVEIGSWKGRSTIALAMGLRSRGSGRVYAIDPHTGSREHIEAYGSVDTFQAFLNNIKTAGVADLVDPIRSTSHEARPRFADDSVNVLFVDGSHEYRDVITDIHDWTPTLLDGSVVAFNDPLMPGVYQALREAVLIAHSPYRNARYISNTLFFRFRTQARWHFGDSVLLHWLRVLLALRYRAQAFVAYMPGWAVRSGRRLYERLLSWHTASLV